MKPVAVTFVDQKMLSLAQEQAKNCSAFDIEHEIVPLQIRSTMYDTELWIDQLEKTIAAIEKHKKIMRLDAEIRIHKPLPQTWLDADNVLFQPWPLIKTPFYIATNTGQMVLSESGIPFLRILIKCMRAMIPPDGDTSLPLSGPGHVVEDEWPSGIAIALSGIEFHQERLSHDRRLAANCAANRGLWLEENTVLTHPALHNWGWPGTGLSQVEGTITINSFCNHFAPLWDIKRVRLIADLLIARNVNWNLWESLATHKASGIWEVEGWQLYPIEGLCAPIGHKFKRLTR